MDLKELLKKTKKKKEQMGEIIPPAVSSIADDDRPYKSSVNKDSGDTANLGQNRNNELSPDSSVNQELKNIQDKYPLTAQRKINSRIFDSLPSALGSEPKEPLPPSKSFDQNLFTKTAENLIVHVGVGESNPPPVGSKLKQSLTESTSSLLESASAPSNEKQETDAKQSQAKLTTNSQQNYNKVTTNLQQSYNKSSISKWSPDKTYNKLPTQPTTRPTTKLQQSYNKLTTESAITSLVGLQRRIVLFFYELCRAKGARLTQNISIAWLAVSCETSIRSAQETIRRLEIKGCVRRKEYKNGRGGWTIYELPEGVYQELFQLETYNKVTTNIQQTPNKLPTQPTTQPTTKLSSSSSVLNIENKTTTQHVSENPDWIETINLELVQTIGVTKSVLKRCLDLYPTLTPEGLEDLVSRFSEFMKEPKNRVQNARGFFIGLAKQLSEGIIPLDHIETSNDRLMREYNEKLKEKRARTVKVEQETLEFEFDSWLEKLPRERQLEIVPENQFAKSGSGAYRASLKHYFLENVWPSRRRLIIEGQVTAP